MRVRSIKRQAFRSVIANWLGYLSHAAIALIVTPIIIHSLGNARYGIWSLVMSVTGYYGLLNFGIRSSLTKYVAEYAAKDDKEEVSRLVNSSLIFFAGISLSVVCVSLIVSNYILQLFLIESVSVDSIKLLIIITGLNVACSFLFQPFDAILVSLNRFDLMNIIGVASSLIRAVLIVCILKCGYGLIAMALVIMCVDLMTFVVIAFSAKGICPELSIKLKYINKQSLSKLFSFGKFNFLRHMSRIVLIRSDVIIIGVILGPTQVAFYAIAESLQNMVSLIVKAISRVIMPVASSLSAKGENTGIQKLILQFPKYIMPLALFIGVQFFFFGETFLDLWLGEGYRQSYVVFCILMIPKIFMMSHDTMIETVVGIGENKFVGYLALIEALLNILISLYLVKKMGVIGVALGTVIPLTVTRGIIVPVYCCMITRIEFLKYVKTVWLPSMAMMFVCSGLTYLTVNMHRPISYMGMAVHIQFVFMVVLYMIYFFEGPDMKKRIIGMISKGAQKIIGDV